MERIVAAAPPRDTVSPMLRVPPVLYLLAVMGLGMATVLPAFLGPPKSSESLPELGFRLVRTGKKSVKSEVTCRRWSLFSSG